MKNFMNAKVKGHSPCLQGIMELYRRQSSCQFLPGSLKAVILIGGPLVGKPDTCSVARKEDSPQSLTNSVVECLQLVLG